jgi:uncharacterized peroxidase-related enzyme
MNHVEPLAWEDVADLHPIFEPIRERMGFVPTSQLVMARRPRLLQAFLGLAKAVYDPEAETSLQLRNLVALVASKTAGCRYCTAHTANNAGRSGVDERKIAAVWEFESHPDFEDSERAALRFAVAAASVPNLVDPGIMADLKTYYSDDQIVELMGVIAFFGFLNRWNDSMATALEDDPMRFAGEVLTDTEWTPGKHRG